MRKKDRPMIQLRTVSKKYILGALSVTALDRVSLAIGSGEFIVVLGPSGSGKTTLLNMIGALDTPTGGEISIDSRILFPAGNTDLRKFRRETVGFIFQTFNLFPGLTALENVQFALDVRGRRNAVPAARRVLDQVGLGQRMHHFPHQLSGGEQQRVAIARALATGNPMLLADEPTGELDFKTGVQILELLRGQAQSGKTVLVVTHNREISRAADRVIELSSGKIVGDGAPPNHKASMAELSW
jgi:putative ABC transport system ATP-binding protein